MPSGTAVLIEKQKNARLGYLKLEDQSAERSSFHKLSSDLHIPAVASTLRFTHFKKTNWNILSLIPALQRSLIPLRKIVHFDNIIKTTNKKPSFHLLPLLRQSEPPLSYSNNPLNFTELPYNSQQ